MQYVEAGMAYEVNRENSMPKVSVVIPVYNVEPYLNECLDSVINQTLQDIEIICIDDESADGSLKILQEYCEKDSRITVVTQKNSGPGAARNTGLAYVTGKYVLLMDSDDFIELEMLEKMFSAAEAYGLDLVICEADTYDEVSRQYKNISWNLRSEQIPEKSVFSSEDLGNHLFQFCRGWAWDKLYRTEFVKANLLIFPDLKNSEDLIFVFPSLVKAKKIGVIHEVLTHYRIKRKDSVSNTRNENPLCFLESSKMLKKYLMANQVYKGNIKRSYINWALEYALWNLNSLSGSSYRFVYNTLKNSGFSDLDIIDDKEYFENRMHYRQYKSIMKYSLEDFLLICASNMENKLAEINLEKAGLGTATSIEKKESWSNRKKLIEIYYSKFYKLAELFASMPGKIRRGHQYYYDHGFKYTIKKLLEHF